MLPSGERYNLILAEIHAVVVGHKSPGKVKGTAGSCQGLPKLGPG